MPTLESFFTVFGPRYDLPAPLIDQTVAGAVLVIFGKLTMSIAAIAVCARWFGSEHKADEAGVG